MALPVNTVAAGGLAVVDVSLVPAYTKFGVPVSEATTGRGTAVTKVADGGVPVVFVTSPPLP